jgi:hypothetical protein
MWTQRARRDLGYSLTQIGNPQQNPHINAIPSPGYNSAHYMFLGQPYKIIEDPSTSSVQVLSQASSTHSYSDAFGEDPDDVMLNIIDLQKENNNLREQIHTLQQHIRDLEEEVNVSNLRKSSLATRTHDRIVYLEGQVQKFITDNTMSTPVRNVASKPSPSKTPLSPLRYRLISPSHAAPNEAQIQSPDTSFKHHIHPSVGTPTVSRSPFVSNSQFTSPSAEASSSSCGPLRLVPHYVNLYHLGHLSTSINLINSYTPPHSRIEELLKLGLEEDVCETLANAMALDKGLLHI